MAVRQADLPQPITQQCPCGCGIIDRTQHAYIESRATGLWYGDLICLVEAEGHRYSKGSDYSLITVDGDRYTRKQFKELYEVVEYG